MPYKDKEKQKEYQKIWSQQNAKSKTQQTSWIKRKEMVHQAKDKPCSCCGIKYDIAVMDLHHKDSSLKDSNVSKLMKSSSYQKLQEEIDKCVVLCANCHRMVHAGLIELTSS